MAHKHGIARDFAVFGGLLVLTTGTLLLSFVLKGPPGLTVAYAFATAKASLVAWFFMHLSEERLSSRLALLAGVFLTILLAGLAAADVATRAPIAVHVPVESATGERQ